MIILGGTVAGQLRPRIADHVDHIVQEFQRQGTDIRSENAANGGIDFIHAERQLVVREEYLPQVLDVLQQPALAGANDPPPTVERVTRGVMLLRFASAADRTEGWVLRIVSEIDSRLGGGIATPNHVLTVAQGEMHPCPATEPLEVEDGIEPSPGVRRENSGAGVLIYIADTGLLADAEVDHPWLQGVSSTTTSHPWRSGVMSDEDKLPAKKIVNGQQIQPIDPYDAHGTFVAGVARCIAPEAHIIVGNVFDTAGSALETDFVKKLDAALHHGVDIFHLSVASPTRNDHALVSLMGWMERLGEYKGIVCVVAAGNSHARRPCWPGAFPDAITVGALAADGHSRADFSNYGSWVDVYAPGRDLINAYASGVYTCHAAPFKGQERTFYGMAQWSGTSFSTPIVTGLIAARMSRTGENAQQAAGALLAEARAKAVPGVGPVLLP
jgi:subtilisin family serine protease